MMTNKCTSFAGHFDDHVGTWLQCCVHCLMQHAQGYTQNLWMMPSGNYLLCISPGAARVPCKTPTMKQYTYFAGHFNDGNAPEQYHMHFPMEKVQGASLEATEFLPLGKHLLQ